MISTVISWFTGSRAGRLTAGVLAFAIMALWFYAWAAGNGKLECKVAVQEVSIQETQRQIDAARSAEKAARKRADLAEKKNAEYEQRIANFEAEADAAPDANDVCISGDDIDSLLNIELYPKN